MNTITIQEAAKKLNVGVSSVLTYLAQGKLSGDAGAGLVDVESIRDRKENLLQNRVKNLNAIRQVLESDDLAKKERSVLEMRVDGETYTDIAAALGISWQGAQLIIKRALDKLEQETCMRNQTQRSE